MDIYSHWFCCWNYFNLLFIQNHNQKLWLRQVAEKYILKDLTGKRNELLTHQNNNSKTISSFAFFTFSTEYSTK